MGVISFTYTIIDGKVPPKKSTVTLYCENSGVLTTAELEEIANDSCSVVAQLLTGGLISCHIGFEPNLGAIVANPDLAIPEADSDVEEGAIFVFRPLDGDIRPTKLRIPTFNENYLLEGTRIVDVDEPAVALFILMMTEGAVPYPFDFEFSDSRGEPLYAYLGGEESFKKRRKGRR